MNLKRILNSVADCHKALLMAGFDQATARRIVNEEFSKATLNYSRPESESSQDTGAFDDGHSFESVPIESLEYRGYEF